MFFVPSLCLSRCPVLCFMLQLLAHGGKGAGAPRIASRIRYVSPLLVVLWDATSVSGPAVCFSPRAHRGPSRRLGWCCSLQTRGLTLTTTQAPLMDTDSGVPRRHQADTRLHTGRHHLVAQHICSTQNQDCVSVGL